MAAARAMKDAGGERRPIEAGDPGDRRRRPCRPDRAGAADPDGCRPDPRAPPILVAAGGGAGAEGVARAGHDLALRQVREALQHRRPGAGQRRRPALLRRRPLPLRPAGQGPLRGRAARQQHATGLRPDQGELGGRVSDQPGRPADRGGRRPRSGRPRRSACSPATSARRRGWPASCWTGGSTTSGRTSARTWARPTSGSPRASWPTWPAMDFDPLNVLILIRKPNRPDRASRASRHRLFGNPDDAFAQIAAQAGPDHPGRGPRDRPGAARHPGRPASSGTSAPARARWRSRPPSSPPGDGLRRRARAGRRRLDPGQRRGVRRPQRPAGRRARARGPGDAARARRRLRRRDRPPGRPGPERGLRPAGPGGRHGGQRGDDRRASPRPTRRSRGWPARSSVWNVSIARGIEQMDRLRFEAINPTFLLAVTKREPADD